MEVDTGEATNAEDEFASMTAGQIKHKRTGARSSLSKKIKRIDELIERVGSRSHLRELEAWLIEKTNRCREIHIKYCIAANVSSLEDIRREDEWLSELENAAAECRQRIDKYFEDRQEDPPSSIGQSSRSSTSKHSSTASAAAAKLRATKAEREKQELILQQAQRAAERKLQEASRKAELEREQLQLQAKHEKEEMRERLAFLQLEEKLALDELQELSEANSGVENVMEGQGALAGAPPESSNQLAAASPNSPQHQLQQSSASAVMTNVSSGTVQARSASAIGPPRNFTGPAKAVSCASLGAVPRSANTKVTFCNLTGLLGAPRGPVTQTTISMIVPDSQMQSRMNWASPASSLANSPWPFNQVPAGGATGAPEFSSPTSYPQVAVVTSAPASGTWPLLTPIASMTTPPSTVAIPAASTTQQMQTPATRGHQSSAQDVARWSVSAAPDSGLLPSHLPKLKVQIFDGNPRYWPMFIASFKSLIHDQLSNNAHRLAMLRESLSPNVRAGIARFLFNPDTYLEALKELQQQYGHPYVIAREHLGELLQLPVVNDGDIHGLREFSNRVSGAVGALASGEYGHELQSSGILGQVIQKIPSRLQEEWGQFVSKMQPVIPTLLDFQIWLRQRVMSVIFTTPLIAVSGGGKVGTQSKPKRPTQNRRQHEVKSGEFFVADFASSKQGPDSCVACGGKHKTASCSVMAKLEIAERMKLVWEGKRCICCLEAGHLMRKCPNKKRCTEDGCKKLHHPLIHGAPRLSHKPSEVNSHHAALADSTLLCVVPVRLLANGKRVDTYALIDSGSAGTLIEKGVADILDLAGPTKKIQFKTVIGAGPVIASKMVQFSVLSLCRPFSFCVKQAYTVPSLNLKPGKVDAEELKQRWKHLRNVDIQSTRGGHVAVLIGINEPGAHDITHTILPPVGMHGPRAIETPFGWIAVGDGDGLIGASRMAVNQIIESEVNQEIRDGVLHQMVERFWVTESLGLTPPTNLLMSEEDKRALATIESSTIHTGERYQIGLPWKFPHVSLPNNRFMALRRFYALEAKFKRDKVFADRYAATINEYISLGHARLTTPQELTTPSGQFFYLPHHAVVTSEKVRVVFDASAKVNGVSLNCKLLRGPDLFTSLVSVLTLFRLKRFPISGDIEKMYHQVLVPSSQQAFFRFLWRKPGSNDPVLTYQMTVHVFGARSSPAVCMYAMRRTATDNQVQFPDVAPLAFTNFFVDNYLDSCDSEEEAIRRFHRLRDLLAKGGFNLVKLVSSSRNILASANPANRLRPTLDLDMDPLPTEKTLGVHWDSETDQFKFKITLSRDARTKREILSEIAGIFDPLGFSAPAGLLLKVLLQKIWRCGYEWDQVLPETILSEWKSRCDSMKALENLKIPRCLKQFEFATPDCIQLHVFCDASTVGLGVVAYLRVRQGEAVSVRFVMGKTRVSPLKTRTIPQLELSGLVDGVRLASAITSTGGREIPRSRLKLNSTVIGVRLVSELSSHLNVCRSQVTWWSDSTTVQQWVNSKTMRFSTYVANRIGEILDAATPQQIRHVPGSLNPADYGSRGLVGTDLTAEHPWFTGPNFLLEPEDKWPTALVPPEPDPNNLDNEIIEAYITTSCSLPDDPAPKSAFIGDLLKRFSSWTRATRVVAWMFRVLRSRKSARPGQEERHLHVSEVREAAKRLIRIVQEEQFHNEIKAICKGQPLPQSSSILAATPFRDSEAILRVGGRIDTFPAPYDVRHPIILPSNHLITRLIVSHLHVRFWHLSSGQLLALVRQSYWSPKLRSVVRSVASQCFQCRKDTAKPAVPLMAALPATRLQPHQPPFSIIGIDFFGPYQVTLGRKTCKRYGVLFVDMVIRAVHIEITHTLDTGSFIMAFTRMTNLRGYPAIVYSDNGTNLRAGERELREAVLRLDAAHIQNEAVRRGIDWRFSPPLAPHFGGSWA